MQYFDRNGTWVRPPGARAVTAVLSGGSAFARHESAGPGMGATVTAPADGDPLARTVRAADLPETMAVAVAPGGFALILTRYADEPAVTRQPPATASGSAYPQRRDCPACAVPILVTEGSRHGGQLEAFDPEPGTGPRYDVLLAPDLSCIALSSVGAGHLKGSVPLYRRHQWSCAEGMRVPMTRALPGIGGYSHKAAARKP